VHVASTFDELSQVLGSHHSSVTIGVFDGVHLGHQALINQTVESARKTVGKSVVISFRNHPLSVLAPPYTPRRLVSNSRKADLLESLGIDIILLMDFTPEFAATSPQDFVTKFLVEKAAVRTLICGYDFSFGCKGEGNIDLLRTMGDETGFEIETVPAVAHNNRPVKSTHVRDLLSEGHVSDAAVLLTRPHEVPGVVIAGMQRGRTIGFPTANLAPITNFQVPAQGVYLCGARIAAEDKILPAMINIGTSPTFGENPQTIEAHILDFEGDLHGESLSLYFIERLRDERRFPSIEFLVEQLNKDRDQAFQLWDSTATQEQVSHIPGPIKHQI
jgi:riboflavin kinase/FMN adenylyltransferase